MTSTATPVFPAGRYGRRRDPARRRRARWLTTAFALLVAAGGAAIAVKLYQQYEQAPYAVENVAVGTVTDSSVSVSFDLRRPGGAATCTVVALARNGARLAVDEIEVPAPAAGSDTAHVSYTLHTITRPFTATVQGCGPGH